MQVIIAQCGEHVGQFLKRVLSDAKFYDMEYIARQNCIDVVVNPDSYITDLYTIWELKSQLMRLEKYNG